MRENNNLRFMLQVQAGADALENKQTYKAKADKLQAMGAFRVQQPSQTWKRVGNPNWSGKVRQVASIANGFVTTTEGEHFHVKHALPVPKKSANVDTSVLKSTARGDRLRLGFEEYNQVLEEVLKTGASTVAEARKGIDDYLGSEEFGDALRSARISFNTFLELYNFEVRDGIVTKPGLEEGGGTLNVPPKEHPSEGDVTFNVTPKEYQSQGGGLLNMPPKEYPSQGVGDLKTPTKEYPSQGVAC